MKSQSKALGAKTGTRVDLEKKVVYTGNKVYRYDEENYAEERVWTRDSTKYFRDPSGERYRAEDLVGILDCDQEGLEPIEVRVKTLKKVKRLNRLVDKAQKESRGARENDREEDEESEGQDNGEPGQEQSRRAKEHSDTEKPILRFPRIRGNPISTPLVHVKPKPIRWLWPRRIPKGELTILDGDPGGGKSLLSLEVAAQVSRGGQLPPDHSIPCGNVIILNAEDGVQDTIVPRLKAAGADMRRISVLTGIPDKGGERPFAMPDDLVHLETEILRLRAALVIIDPLVAYFGPKVDSWKDQDVRRALAPLTRTAQQTGTAVLAIRHLNKKVNLAPLYRGGGSIGIIAAPRSGLLLATAPDDPDTHVLVPTKHNLSRRASPLGFRIVPVTIPGLRGTIPKVEWLGTVHITPDELLAGNVKPRRKATAFLRRTLAHGAVSARKVTRFAKAAGITTRTLDRAKMELHVKSTREGGLGDEGKWLWSLPKSGRR